MAAPALALALQTVPLPPPPQNPSIIVPAQPNAPPTVDDVVDAIRYLDEVKASENIGDGCTRQNVYHASVYHGCINFQAICTGAGGTVLSPAWLGQAIEPHTRDLRSMLARTANRQQGTGRQEHFKIVCCSDGSDPTGPIHNLPALSTIDIIDNLTGAQLGQYLAGYNIQPVVVPGGNLAIDQARKKQLKIHIGAPVL